MALTVLQQLSILKGEIRPDSGTLREFIEQISINEVSSFYLTLKNIDADISMDGYKYIDKISRVFTKIIYEPTKTSELLSKIMISLIASTYTLSQVEAASDIQWETFLKENMLKCIEILAGVYPHEILEYNNYA